MRGQVTLQFHYGDSCPIDVVPFPSAGGAIHIILSERQKKSQPESWPKNAVLFVFLAVTFPLRRCEYWKVLPVFIQPEAHFPWFWLLAGQTGGGSLHKNELTTEPAACGAPMEHRVTCTQDGYAKSGRSIHKPFFEHCCSRRRNSSQL